MKKKLFTAIAAAVCALCCAVGLAACGGNQGGNKDGATDKVAEFARVTDGVFISAGYTKGTKQASAKQLTAQSANGGLGEDLNNLYTALKNDTNLTAVGGNLNYIKCDTLYWGANLAGLAKSLALTVGDEVFSAAYDLSALGMPLYSAKISDGDWYTLQGVGKSGGAVVSAIEINFKEYADGAFLFKLAQYEKSNGVPMLSFSCYDSDGAAFTATLRGNESANFSAYDTAYQAFTVQQCRLVIYGKTQYVSSSADTESIMKFAKDNLGFTNNTYSKLAALPGGKTLSETQVKGVTAQMAKNYYTNPYSPDSGDKNSVESISIDSSLSLKAGDTSTLNVTITPANAVYDRLEWSSSNEKVATVFNGKVTAVSEGKATITVTADNGKSAHCTVTVTAKQTTAPDTDEVKDITLNHTALTLYYGADSQTKATLTATISPANPETEKQIEWTTIDSSVIISGSGASVTVEADDISPRAEATYTVTASVGGKSAHCDVTIKKVEYVSVWIDDNGTYCDNMELDVGESLTLEYDLTPADIADLYHFEWHSSDEKVATVSDSGVVKMIGYGEADIYCTAGGQSAYFTVYKVAPPVEVESVTLNKTSLTLTAKQGGETLIATVSPDDAADKRIVWSTSDDKIAGVRIDGEVYGVAAGVATVRATASNGVYAECTVTVNAATVPDRDPEISLNKTNITLESDGDETLVATVAEGITNEFFWRTSNSDVVKVSNGLVTAVGVGNATITVYTADYRYSATCSVTVTLPAEKRLTFTKILKDGEIEAYSVKGIGTLSNEDSITIPAEYKGKPVTAVGDEALWNGKMTHVTISDGIKVISDGAFAWCENLLSVTVPDSVERIGYGAFYQCNALQEISVPFIGESAEATDNATLGYIFNYRQDDAIPQSIAKITVRGGTIVPERAFSLIASVTEIVLPDNVTDIGREAFAFCSSLNKILLPVTLKKIGIGAFYECTSLTKITLPDSLDSIGTNIFGNCTALGEITLPFVGEKADGTGVTVFGHIFGAAAYGDNAIVVPASLKKVILSGGETVRERVFYGCSGIEEIVLPVGLLRINEKAFYGCGLTKMTIPATVTEIARGALEKCNSLAELTLPFLGSGFAGYIFGQVTTEESSSKYVPATLEKIVITGEKIYLSDRAFAYCTGLKELVFEGEVMQIGSYAFDHCDLDIYFNGTKKEWEDTYKLQKWNSYLVATIHCSDGNVTEINNY